MRLGGMVERGSVQHLPDGVTIRFVVTDGKAETPVVFRGIVPDLFREGSGAVAEGRLKRAPSSPTRSSPSMTSAICRPSSAICRPSTKQERRSRNDRRSRSRGALARCRARSAPVPADGRGSSSRRGYGAAMRSIAVVQGTLTLIAFAMLLIVFARSDMSVALVFENSNSAKPFIYKVAGTWGNHEGSMLMWVTILAVAGAFLALLRRRTERADAIAALGAQAVLALGFYAFLLVASNPFARMWPPPRTGRGSIRSSRIQGWHSIRRLFTLAMSGFGCIQSRCRRAADWRSGFPSWLARCGPGCLARGSC